MIVETWMTRSLISISPQTPISEAAATMSTKRIRRLLVVEGGVLAGMVARSDLLRGQGHDPFAVTADQSLSLNKPVSQVMSTHLITVTPTTPLEQAAALMVERKIGALPVVLESGNLVGILTESDAMRALIKSLSFGGPGVRMTFEGTDSDGLLKFLAEHAKRFEMRVLSMIVVETERSHEMIVKMAGSRTDELANAAWKAGFRVRNVGN